MTDEEFAQDLVSAGYMRTSNKYRHIARLPEGETALEALLRCAPQEYNNIMASAERRAADLYRRMGYAEKEGNQLTLTPEQFQAFRKAGGESSW